MLLPSGERVFLVDEVTHLESLDTILCILYVILMNIVSHTNDLKGYSCMSDERRESKEDVFDACIISKERERDSSYRYENAHGCTSDQVVLIVIDFEKRHYFRHIRIINIAGAEDLGL